MGYRVANSLNKLLAQLDKKFPGRDKKSDGAIGDERHKSSKSDHNPWIKDSKGTGVVTARDFTHDPANGIDCGWLLKVLLATKDPRIKYIIYARRIYNVRTNFTPEVYKGVNAHNHHLHLSVSRQENLFDDISNWNLESTTENPEPTDLEKIPRQLPTLTVGDKGGQVRDLQTRLAKHGLLKISEIDGDFGPRTETAVKEYQVNHNLRVDGMAGPNTLRSLGVK